MTDFMSDDASFRIDNDTGVLTDISNFVNNVDFSGGNEPVDNTGLGQGRRSEQGGLGTIMAFSITGYVNTTTEAIFGSVMAGTSTTKTVEYSPDGSQYHTGEATVGAVSLSAPIGLQTFSAELRSSDSTGFNRTSEAAS